LLKETKTIAIKIFPEMEDFQQLVVRVSKLGYIEDN